MTYPVVIYFVGLIAHLQYSTAPPPAPVKNVAALVVEAGHKPRLVVTKTAVRGTPSFPWIEDIDGKYSSYDLSGPDPITIDNITAGTVTRSANFTNEVTKLTDATRKTDLKAGVKAETDHTAVYAYIELPGGTLGVAGYYPDNYQLAGGTTQCVPSRTSLNTDTLSGNVITFKAGSKTLEIDVSSKPSITIANLPTNSMATGHFKSYASLMHLGDRNQVKLWARDSTSCAKTPTFNPSEVGIGKADTADCTNTHFP